MLNIFNNSINQCYQEVYLIYGDVVSTNVKKIFLEEIKCLVLLDGLELAKFGFWALRDRLNFTKILVRREKMWRKMSGRISSELQRCFARMVI